MTTERKPTPGKLKRKKIHPYVPAEQAMAVKTYAALKRVSESSVVSAALAQYLAGTSDATLLLKRLNRLQNKLTAIEALMNLLSESFALYVEIYFAHTPTIHGEDAKATARSASAARFADFIDALAQRMSTTNRFASEVLPVLADQDELAAAARAAAVKP
ncbi:hypothetical protein OWM54_43035 [Myxococcus sp. MISCRS1]|uniref:hypothetical protein n=1 Tax=Myxococcus sp. MISCRS1 TaxID=2996786 RepID=UPI0022708FB8|nr:hypothetical protein [Myxococcus sp. MISCRS1]MCY1003941.1 hypothetical protein [Myxococcus sp. MISCRS1]